MKAPPKISVCIPTYLREDVLLNSLSLLAESEFDDFEILIVDNGGSELLPTLLRDHALGARIRLVTNPENAGCASLNLLFPQALGAVIVCLDDDSYPARDCLGRVSTLFTKDPSLGMIGFKLRTPDDREWHDAWWNPAGENVRPTVFCAGCGLAFRNDERLPKERLCLPEIRSQNHELSISAEIARLGYRIEFHPECVAYHMDTTLGYHGTKAEMGNRNQYLFLVAYADAYHMGVLCLSAVVEAMCLRPRRAMWLASRLAAKRHPLPQAAMRRFTEVARWHVHPRLQRLLPSPAP